MPGEKETVGLTVSFLLRHAFRVAAKRAAPPPDAQIISIHSLLNLQSYMLVSGLYGVGRIGKIAGELGGGIKAFREGMGEKKEDTKDTNDTA